MSPNAEEAQVLTASLRRMGLINAGEKPMLTELPGGVSSIIVRADTRRGPLCIKRALPKLKVAAEWFAPVERNSAEVAWMKIAGSVAPGSVPQVLGEDGEAQAFAMAYLEPAAYPVWKTQLRDGLVENRTARTVGATLAVIHRATSRNTELAHTFANDQGFYAIRLEPYLAATARAHPDCAAALQRLIDITAQTKLALVHGDISPKNILVGRDGPVFLDAECAWYGDPAFDLAFCSSHLLLKCAWVPNSTNALLSCFDALAEGYMAGVNWEATDALESRTAALLPGLLLARIDGKSPVEYLTDERERDRIRRFAISLLRNPEFRLAAIRDRWAMERTR